jgi:DNA polymerase III psi subunit
MYSEQENDRFKEFANLFTEAERLEKELEIESSSYFHPSINELRYAGKHISHYLVSRENSAYDKAVSHVLRAIYDARDMLLLLNLEKINIFEKTYKSISIVASISNWAQIRARINRIKKLSSNPDFKNNRKEFDDIYNELKNIWELLEAAVPELDKQRNFNKKSFIITIVSMIVAIASAIIAFFK